ncbi:hypothetical protein BYT27DRAFT_6527915 [Phlegmacium glaucopus]|nr:hypothetical protein BYT27DRAFT_6527915 [Phlegmacium glaucopus]
MLSEESPKYQGFHLAFVHPSSLLSLVVLPTAITLMSCFETWFLGYPFLLPHLVSRPLVTDPLLLLFFLVTNRPLTVFFFLVFIYILDCA